MIDQFFTLVNEEGVETACELLFSFHASNTNKDYLVYTDHTTDEFGFETVFASVYDPTQPALALEAIETEEEWDMVDVALEVIQSRTDENPQLNEDILLTAAYI